MTHFISLYSIVGLYVGSGMYPQEIYLGGGLSDAALRQFVSVTFFTLSDSS